MNRSESPRVTFDRYVAGAAAERTVPDRASRGEAGRRFRDSNPTRPTMNEQLTRNDSD
jgi:hypothetical protein